MLDFISATLKTQILNSFKTVYEVRLRVDKQVTVKGNDGTGALTKRLSYKTSKLELEQTVLRLCNHSVYSVESSLKNGFITSQQGERVGICGEVVTNGEQIISIKNFTSLSIRFPHVVYGCSDLYVSTLKEAKSCLVVSPPFHGKTTFIRDLAKSYSDKFFLNVLYVDERDELCGGGHFNIGEFADVLRFSNKSFGFLNGVRAYNPDVIVCDEIMDEADCKSVEFAVNSGVKVIASAHSNSLKNLLKKQYLSAIIKENTFDDIILLDNFKIAKIYKEQDWSSLF